MTARRRVCVQLWILLLAMCSGRAVRVGLNSLKRPRNRSTTWPAMLSTGSSSNSNSSSSCSWKPPLFRSESVGVVGSCAFVSTSTCLPSFRRGMNRRKEGRVGLASSAVDASSFSTATIDGDCNVRPPPYTDFSTGEHSTRAHPCASHLQHSHILWESVVRPGDTVIDCTAGNGNDSVRLGKMLGLGPSAHTSDSLRKLQQEGGEGWSSSKNLSDGTASTLHVIDIQQTAIDGTRERLEREFGAATVSQHIVTTVGNFAHTLPLLPLPRCSVKLIVYNLGYLPGSAKETSFTTNPSDTLQSLEHALTLVGIGGMVSVMCYRGHEGGQAECDAVRKWAEGLDKRRFRAFVHERLNSPLSPSLITVFRPGPQGTTMSEACLPSPVME